MAHRDRADGVAGSGWQVQRAETNESRNFLPSDAESTRAYERIQEIVKSDSVPLVAVIRRDGGLTAADQRNVTQQLRSFNATSASTPLEVEDDKGKTREVTLRDAVRGPQGWLAVGDRSRDGTTVLVFGAVKVTGDSDRLLDAVDALREGVTPLRSDGLTVKVTGGAGFSYDAVKVFSNLNATLAGRRSRSCSSCWC